MYGSHHLFIFPFLSSWRLCRWRPAWFFPYFRLICIAFLSYLSQNKKTSEREIQQIHILQLNNWAIWWVMNDNASERAQCSVAIEIEWMKNTFIRIHLSLHLMCDVSLSSDHFERSKHNSVTYKFYQIERMKIWCSSWKSEGSCKNNIEVISCRWLGSN